MSTNPVHAHELLSIIEEREDHSRESLRAAAIERFGAEARYTNCSEKIFTFEEVMDFLMAKGKVVAGNAGLRVDRGMACAGHDGHA